MSPLTESTRVVLTQPTGASWAITPTSLLPDDADAVAYIAAVEAADGEALEPAVRLAINSFVKGCKADGIWPAIKASCILAGARTLNGALVPLVGAAPTNYNFVSGDYNRKTGLVGDGSTKYLDSNRTNSVDPQDSRHVSVYSTTASSVVNSAYIDSSADARTRILASSSNLLTAVSNNSNSTIANGNNPGTGFIGLNRSEAARYNVRVAAATAVINVNSSSPGSANFFIYRQSSAYANARLAFYSIGEALDLALLDTRVTALVNALAAAIP